MVGGPGALGETGGPTGEHTLTIYAEDQQQAIRREMDLHGLVYEFSKHRSLIESWNLMRKGLDTLRAFVQERSRTEQPD